MNNQYIKEYLNIINEFNTNNYIHYGVYKMIHLYISRSHFLLQQETRYKNLTDLNLLKRNMKKFIKIYYNQLLALTGSHGIFLTVENKNYLTYPYIYYAMEFQSFNKKYELLAKMPLPCTDENGNIIKPYHAVTDIEFTISY